MAVAIGSRVCVGSGVCVDLGVLLGLGVGVFVGIGVPVGMGVPVGTGVSVGTDVSVGADVGFGSGVAAPHADVTRTSVMVRMVSRFSPFILPSLGVANTLAVSRALTQAGTVVVPSP